MSQRNRRHNYTGPKLVRPTTISLEDLIALAPDGSNVAEWREKLSLYFQAENATIGAFLRTIGGAPPAYAVRPPIHDDVYWEDIQAGPGGFTDADIRKMRMNELEARNKRILDDVEIYQAWFAVILQTLSVKQCGELALAPTWDAVYGARMPLELINIVETTLVYHTAGLADTAQQDVLFKRFVSVTQQWPREDVSDYTRRVEQLWNCLVAANHPQRGTLQALIRRTVQGLDKRRFGAYCAKVANEETDGMANAYPATLAGIASAAALFVDPHASARSQAMPAPRYAYAMQMAEESSEVEVCPHCHRPGHGEDRCWDKHPKLRPARLSANRKPAAGTATVSEKKDDAKPAGSGKKKKKTVKPITAYATGVSTAASNSEVMDDLWHFTAYTTSVCYATAFRETDPRLLTIDSFANFSFAANPLLLRGMHPRRFDVRGATGAGEGTHMGYLPGFGIAAYLPQAGVNALSIRDAHRYLNTIVPLHSWTIHISPTYDLVFPWDDEAGHYSVLLTDHKLREIESAIGTPADTTSSPKFEAYATSVAELERSYPKSEVKAAREARVLQERLFFPSDYTLVKALTTGSFVNCRTVPKAVKLAKDIYRIDPAVAAGKTKRKGPVVRQEIPVPVDMRRDQTLYGDAFFWRGEPFLLFIAKPLYIVLCRHIPGSLQNSVAIAKEVEAVVTKVQSRGFVVTKIKTDSDSKLVSLVGVVPLFDTTGAGSHLGDIEVEIRVVKERLRCMEASLTVPVPKRLIVWMVYAAVTCRNMLPRPFQTITSRESFTGVKTDIKRDVRAKFFDHILAERPPSDEELSGPVPRTAPALYLMGTGNAEGSVFAYDLTTEAVFRCDHFKPAPMSELVVSKIFELWERDEPITQRRRRAMWKLYYGGRVGRGPILPVHEDGEGGDLAELAVLPVERGPQGAPKYPDEDLVDHNAPHTMQGGESSAGIVYPVDAAGARGEPAREAPHLQDGVEPAVDASGPEGGDDFSPDVRSSVDLSVPEGDTALYVESIPALGYSIMEDGTKRSARIASRRVDAYTLRAYRTSLRAALAAKDKGGREAIMAELQQMLDKSVWQSVDAAKLSVSQLKKVIRSHIFVKEKLDAAGKFVKMKARMVAGGDGQDKTIYENISSPTVSLEAVFVIVAIAAAQRRQVATVDITGAYLECELPEGDEVHMRLDPLTAHLLSQIDPTVVPHRRQDGSLIVKLKRALYGCVQSARLWFERLRSVLVANGFVANPYDLCTFNRDVLGSQVTVAFHVDDLLITSVSSEALDDVISQLRACFAAVSVTRGAVHTYLGMQLAVGEGHYTIDMSGYINNILKDAPVARDTAYPAALDLMTDDESSPLLDTVRQKYFHSAIAKILFVAKRVRMQCLTTVSVLASKVNKATVQDSARLDKLFAYLRSSKEIMMKFACGGTISPLVFVDASWAVHDDCHGRTGIVVTIAGCAVGAWSYKQKMVTRSSTESEIVALSDALSHVMWYRRWLSSQGHVLPPTVVYQDNQAVISLMRSERRCHQRTKHLDARYFYARDLELAGEISIVWLPTALMVADLMTKPVQGDTFTTLTGYLTGNIVFVYNNSIKNHYLVLYASSIIEEESILYADM